MLRLLVLLSLATALSAVPRTGVPTSTVANGTSGFLKGQTHAHSSGSGDSVVSPEAALAFYDAHDYDFVVFTDHNRVTSAASTARTLAIPGVEITRNFDGNAIHVNALFATRSPWLFPGDASHDRADVYRHSISEASSLGAIAQLNHPRFYNGADAAMITDLAKQNGLALLEIANQSESGSNDDIWDAALSAGAHVYGIASDDAHEYDAAHADLGFVMVRAEKNEASIRAAMSRGDFYSSTGVILDRVEASNTGIDLHVESGAVRFDLIGEGGRVLSSASGSSAHFDLAGISGRYVRVVATDDAGHKAWLQPVFSPAAPAV